eukprot:24070-Chlamydomonas_euryale.AAC.1
MPAVVPLARWPVPGVVGRRRACTCLPVGWMWRAPVCARVAWGGGACGVGVVGRAAVAATPASVEKCREAWASGRGRRQ